MLTLPDVNVLLAASHLQAAGHAVAHRWLADAFSGSGRVGLAWGALIGFVRISTRRGIFDQPFTVEVALGTMQSWLAQPNAVVLHPGPRHTALLSGLLMGAGTAGNLTNDAHLAAIAIEHGARMASFDKDFERFAGLHFERLKA